jgi:peptidoglycan/xylan/chitin deacetylase (PgdA/CDA1 family)
MVHKVAYLTIDDAPSADFKQKVDYLLSREIPAVFFCPGEALEECSDEVIEAVKRGYVIGNHGYDHPHFSEITLDACFEQIHRTDTLIEDIYRKSRMAIPMKCFRFPYGDKGDLTDGDVFSLKSELGIERKQAIQDYLRQLGYAQPKFPDITYTYYREANLLDDVDWYWTYDVHEWSINQVQPVHDIETLDDVFARMEEVVPDEGRGLNSPGSSEIILLHDHIETTSIFAAIIERLLQKGIEFRLPS